MAEGGLASAAVICALVACYLFLAYRSWRTANPNLRLVAYGRAGSICVGLLLMHSYIRLSAADDSAHGHGRHQLRLYVTGSHRSNSLGLCVTNGIDAIN